MTTRQDALQGTLPRPRKFPAGWIIIGAVAIIAIAGFFFWLGQKSNVQLTTPPVPSQQIDQPEPQQQLLPAIAPIIGVGKNPVSIEKLQTQMMSGKIRTSEIVLVEGIVEAILQGSGSDVIIMLRDDANFPWENHFIFSENNEIEKAKNIKPGQRVIIRAEAYRRTDSGSTDFGNSRLE